MTSLRLRWAAYRAVRRKRALDWTLHRLSLAYRAGYIDRAEYDRRCERTREAFR